MVQAFQFTSTPRRPVNVGARFAVSMRSYDPDSAALSSSARLERAIAAIRRAGYNVKFRVDDSAGLVNPSLVIEGVSLVSRKSISDVAQEMIDLARRAGLAVAGGRGVLFAPRRRGRRAGLLTDNLLPGTSEGTSNTFGDVPVNWPLLGTSAKQAYVNANLDVRILQSALNTQPSSLPRLAVDGVYGSKTRARVKEFQSNNFLVQTGNVDPQTFALLGGPARAGVSQVVVPGPVTITPRPSTPAPVGVGRGAIVDAVITVGMANRVLAYSGNLKQQLIDKLNVSGFKVVSANDSNVAVWSGGSLRVRAQITGDGYASADDAASVIGGVAAGLGYNVTGSTGAIVSGASAGSGADGTPGGDSGIGTILLLIGGVALGGIVLSKLAKR